MLVSRLESGVLRLVSAVALVAVLGGAMPAAAGSAVSPPLADQPFGFTMRIQNLPGTGVVDLKFDPSTIQLTGVDVGAVPGATRVKLLDNELIIQGGLGTTYAGIDLYAKSPFKVITGTASIAAGATVTVLFPFLPQQLANGPFKIPQAALSAPVHSSVIHVSPPRTRAGGTVRIYGTASGCPSGDRLAVISRAFGHQHLWAGLPAVLTIVRRGGTFSTRATIPSARHPGVYTITALCGARELVSTQLTVRPAHPPRVRFTG